MTNRGPATVSVVAAAVAVATLGASSCAPASPIPAEDLLLRVASDSIDVDSGRAFGVTVVRVWQRDLVPAEWSDGALAPLVLRETGVSRREDAHRIEETRTFRGYAFGDGEVRVPPPRFEATPRAGGPVHTVAGDGLTLRVRPAIDARSPGPVEFPEGPLRERAPWWTWIVGACAVALAAARLLGRRRGVVPAAPPPAPAPTAPPVPPSVVALGRLRTVRQRAPGDAPAIAADFVETSAIVRDFIADRFGVHTHERTSEELLAATAAHAAIDPDRRRLLKECLARCDSVKFAKAAPDGTDRARLLDLAEAFVAGAFVTGTDAAPTGTNATHGPRDRGVSP